MLSKAPVHHYGGTNVSAHKTHAIFLRERLAVYLHCARSARPLQPSEGETCSLWRVHSLS